MEIQFWDVKKLGMLYKKLDCPETLLDSQIYAEKNLKLLHQYGMLTMILLPFYWEEFWD